MAEQEPNLEHIREALVSSGILKAVTISDAEREKIQKALAVELTPYGVLELQYVLWKSGLAKRKPALGPHFRASSLALAGNPIYLSEAEVYSITHTVIYLTDFAGPCGLPPPIRQRALDMVRPLLVQYRRAGNWDITGELLLNLIGLDSAGDPLFAANMQALCSAQWQDGAVPGPYYSHSDSQAGGGDYIFKNRYHTTLVSMMLWAAYLHRRHGQ